MVDALGCLVRQCEFAAEVRAVDRPCLAWVLSKRTCRAVLDRCRERKHKREDEDATVGDARLYQYAQSAYKALLFLLAKEPSLMSADAADAKTYLTTVLHTVRTLCA